MVVSVNPYIPLSDGIFCFDTGFLRPHFVASYVVVEGAQAALIDVGVAPTVPRVLELLQQADIAPAQVKYVILTHIHLDHAGGAGALLTHLPNAQVVVHPRGVPHLIAPRRLLAAAAAVYGADQVRANFGEMRPLPAARIIEAEQALRLYLGGRELLIMETPGHARHHLCIVDDASQGIFTGDTFGVSYPEFETARGAFILPNTSPSEFAPDDLHASLDILMSFRPAHMYLSHFGGVTDVERLAHDLHAGLDAYVQFAQEADRAPAADRRRHLTQRLTSWLTARLQQHGCSLDQTAIMALAAPDITLSVQGLEIWLDRQKKACSRSREQPCSRYI